MGGRWDLQGWPPTSAPRGLCGSRRLKGDLFQPDSAIFAIERALPTVAEAGRALIKRDCVEVMRLHQDGRGESVGVIQSPITFNHLAAWHSRSAWRRRI